MRADDRLRDVESKPPALTVGRARLVRLVEAVKQQRKLFGWNRLAGISDTEPCLLPVLLQNQPQISAHGAELDGVIEQVIHNLRDRVPVGLCPDRLFWQVDAYLQATRVDFLLKRNKNVTHHIAEVKARLARFVDSLCLQTA